MILEELILYTVVTQFEIFAIDPLASCGTRSISGVLNRFTRLSNRDYTFKSLFSSSKQKGKEKRIFFTAHIFPGGVVGTIKTCTVTVLRR